MDAEALKSVHQSKAEKTFLSNLLFKISEDDTIDWKDKESVDQIVEQINSIKTETRNSLKDFVKESLKKWYTVKNQADYEVFQRTLFLAWLNFQQMPSYQDIEKIWLSCSLVYQDYWEHLIKIFVDWNIHWNFNKDWIIKREWVNPYVYGDKISDNNQFNKLELEKKMWFELKEIPAQTEPIVSAPPVQEPAPTVVPVQEPVINLTTSSKTPVDPIETAKTQKAPKKLEKNCPIKEIKENKDLIWSTWKIIWKDVNMRDNNGIRKGKTLSASTSVNFTWREWKIQINWNNTDCYEITLPWDTTNTPYFVAKKYIPKVEKAGTENKEKTPEVVKTPTPVNTSVTVNKAPEKLATLDKKYQEAMDQVKNWKTVEVATYISTFWTPTWDKEHSSNFELYKKDGKFILEMNNSEDFSDKKFPFNAMPTKQELEDKINEMKNDKIDEALGRGKFVWKGWAITNKKYETKIDFKI